MAQIGAIGSYGRDDIAVVGGKAANLGELVRAGLPVPPGFVVTTDAYREVVVANGLTEAILDRAASGDGAGIRALIEAAAVPASLRDELAVAYADLGSPPVAVRSSATAEDLAGASFAGQQDTYLNVRGLDALVDAVRRCWASLWTDRALDYRARADRERAGVDSVTVALVVVVQELVDADAAGVMFTANPVNGRRDETVFSAAWGLGEAVVASAVDTDQVVVRGGRVHHRTTADKAVLTVRTPTGTQEQPVPADRRRRPVLDDNPVLALAGLGDRIARTSAPHRTSSGPEPTTSCSSSRPGRSPPCRRPRPTRRPPGPCPSAPRSISGPASSSSCPIRCRRCSPTWSTDRSAAPCKP